MSLRRRALLLAAVATVGLGLLAGCSRDPDPGPAPAIAVTTIVDGAGHASAATVTAATSVQVDPGTKIRFRIKATTTAGVQSLQATIGSNTATSSGVRTDGSITTELLIEKVTGGNTFGATMPALGGAPVVLHVQAASFTGRTTSFDVTFVSAEVKPTSN